MILDLEEARCIASAGAEDECVPVTRRWLARAVEEIAAGRLAAAELGRERQLHGMIADIAQGAGAEAVH